MTDGIWVLGATGRTGRAVAADLEGRGLPTVRVGRDAARLGVAGGDARILVLPSLEAMADAIRRERPRVVVNTVGPFTETAGRIARACLAVGASYADLANDVGSALAILGRHDAAVAAGSTLVTGAGFGVTATESVVSRLCDGRPPADDVRVDMLPSLALEAGVVGDALAASFVEGLPGVPGGARFQSRRYRGGRLAPARIAGDPQVIDLPDGTSRTTVGVPFGELVAAQRASGAASVISASSELPSTALARLLFPPLLRILGIAPLRRLARARLGAMPVAARPRPHEHSWAHAHVRWSDGTVREGFLRLGDAGVFTASICAEVAARLHAGLAAPGASTPTALFGSGLVEACGAEFVLPAPDDAADRATNRAASLPRPGAQLRVGAAPVPTPGIGEIAVRARAVALNPVDALPGIARRVVLPWLAYPAVLGSDVAGEVVGVGPDVTRFRIGDRVVGHAVGQERGRDSAAEGAFQELVVLRERMTSRIPDALPFERAAVLPLATSTAACGLFEPDLLALRRPRPRRAASADTAATTESVLVWGAGTTVGLAAIQLARSAGYDVVATAGRGGADLARSVGARVVVDRTAPNAVAELVDALDGRRLAGAIAIGAGSAFRCVAVAARVPGAKAVASAMPGPVSVPPRLQARRRGVRFGTIWGGALQDDDLGPAIYRDFLPDALADGSYQAVPKPLVLGRGLQHIQPGLDRLRGGGVHGTKLVVEL